MTTHDLTRMWNLMDNLNYEGTWGQTHRWRADDSWWGWDGEEGLSKKEKGLMDTDNSVVIAEGKVRRLNGSGKIQ